MNSILDSYIGILSNAHGNLIDEARWLLGTFIAFEMVFFGLWWALGADNRIAEGIKKLLNFGFWIWIVTAFPNIVSWLNESFIAAGFRAVNYTSDTSVLFEPGAVMDLYFTASAPIVAMIEDLSWYKIGHLSLFGLALIGLLLAYLIMAAQVFLVTLEFYIVCAAAIILLPFGVFKHTSFLGEKAIGALVSFGIKFMVMAILLGLAYPVLSSLVPASGASGEITIRTAIETMASTLLIAFLFWNAPGVVAGLLSGSPSLRAGTAAQNLVAGSIVTGIGASAMLGMTRSAALTTVAAGARTAGAVSTGADVAYSAARMGGASKAAAVVSGMGGGIRAASSLVLSTVSKTADSVTSAAEKNYRAGGRNGFVGTGGKLTAGMAQTDVADRKGSSGTLMKSAPSWSFRALRAMHVVPSEARPSGGSSGFKLM